jgi:hypothetical protein
MRTSSHAPSAQLVREARTRYLAENGFTLASYTEPSFYVSGLPIPLPNTENRQRALPRHDLHHVATGYGTDFVGEAEIGAWELRAGCTSLATYFLNGGAALIGLCIAPRRVLRAWKLAKGHTSLYRLGLLDEALLDGTVGELRRRLGVPSEGLADEPAGLHRDAPARPLEESHAPPS